MASRVRKGPVAQRQLVVLLKELIDAASAPNSTAHRDQARRQLRETLDSTNWRTIHVQNGIGPRRCRYLTSIGYWTLSKYMLTDWKDRPGEEKPEDEYE